MIFLGETKSSVVLIEFVETMKVMLQATAVGLTPPVDHYQAMEAADTDDLEIYTTIFSCVATWVYFEDLSAHMSECQTETVVDSYTPLNERREPLGTVRAQHTNGVLILLRHPLLNYMDGNANQVEAARSYFDCDLGEIENHAVVNLVSQKLMGLADILSLVDAVGRIADLATAQEKRMTSVAVHAALRVLDGATVQIHIMLAAFVVEVGLVEF